jgi:hypothetical protein
MSRAQSGGTAGQSGILEDAHGDRCGTEWINSLSDMELKWDKARDKIEAGDRAAIHWESRGTVTIS